MAEAVLEDHADLDAMVVELRELCRRLRDGRVGLAATPSELIEEFAAQLASHFSAEQAERDFDGVVREQPRLLRRMERLREEHEEMAVSLERLVEFARTDFDARELAARLGRFLDAFEAHEQVENRLMQELLLLDESTGGSPAAR